MPQLPLQYPRPSLVARRSHCFVPPPGVSLLSWDLGMGGVCALASTVWVKVCTSLARSGKLSPQVSRKIVHTTCGPLFMLLWPFFSAEPSARFIAAGVPLMQAMRLTAAGLSGVGEGGVKSLGGSSKNELVIGISRTGKASETLGGPLIYALVLTLVTAVGWRSSVVGMVAVSQLAAGDGMADLVGRRFGKRKWWWSDSKSYVGSLAFALGGFLTSCGLIAWFHARGCLAISTGAATTRVAAISLACALVELMPSNNQKDNTSEVDGSEGGKVRGPSFTDDNVTVPVAAAVLSRLLF
ncbi:unnamed protein product [Choristocarpus tenellus]